MIRLVSFFAPRSIWHGLLLFAIFEMAILSVSLVVHAAALGLRKEDLLLVASLIFAIAAPFLVLLLTLLSQQKKLQDQLARLASTDSLTGLLNRRGFFGAIGDDDTLRISGDFLLVDIDHFKKVNDTFGHAAGDLCLKETGRHLPTILPGSAVVGRLGGEEFGILLDHRASRGGAFTAALAELLSRGLAYDDGRRITMSVGIARVRAGETISEAMRRADLALYLAKQEGRACYRHWTTMLDHAV